MTATFQHVPDALAPAQPPPVATPAVQPDHRTEHRVLLAAAVVTALLLARHYLKKRDTPKPAGAREQAMQAWSLAGPVWLKLAVPVILALYERHKIGQALTEAERRALAVNYTTSLGDYLGNSSADAIADGFDRQLARGWHPDVAWHRSAEGYGLDTRTTRSYVDRLLATAEKGPRELVPQAVMLAVSKALAARADTVAGNEAHGAVQTGQAMSWIWEARTGRIPQGSRKEWDMRSAQSHCEVCQELHGRQVSVHEPFETDDGIKLWAPPAHPDCRCHLKLVQPEKVEKVGGGLSRPVRPFRTGQDETLLEKAYNPQQKRDALGRFAVTGGRDYADTEVVRAALAPLDRRMTLVHGDATGADRLAASLWEGPTEAHPAEWNKHGRKAGPMRNQQMVDSGLDFVVRFPGGRGTEDMSRRTAKAGIPIIDHSQVNKAYNPQEKREPKGSPRGGRWTRTTEAEADPQVEAMFQQAAALAEEETTKEAEKPVSPYATGKPASPYAGRSSPYARATSPYAKPQSPYAVKPASPYAAAASPYAAQAPSPYAPKPAVRHRIVTRRTILFTTPRNPIPPEPREPGQSEYYLPLADLGVYSQLPVHGYDFDRAHRFLQDAPGLHDAPFEAKIAESPWEFVEMVDVDDREWQQIMNQAVPLWDEVHKHPEEWVDHPDLSDDEIRKVAQRAGRGDLTAKAARDIIEGPSDLQQDLNLADAFADYVVWKRPDILPELDNRTYYNDFGQPMNPSGEQLYAQLAAQGFYYDESGPPVADVVPGVMTFSRGPNQHGFQDMQGFYDHNWTVYHSAINEQRYQTPPGHIGVVEYDMAPVPHWRYDDQST